MNKFMTRWTQPNNIQTMFWKITPMVSMNIIMLLTAVITNTWFFNLSILHSVHQGSSSLIHFWMFSFAFLIIFLGYHFTIFRFSVFLGILTIGRNSLVRLPILLGVFFSFGRMRVSQPSFNSCCRLFKFRTTRFASGKMSIFICFIVVKLFNWFSDSTFPARFHGFLLNGALQLEGDCSGRISELECMRNKKRLLINRPEHANYNTLGAIYG